MSSAICEGRLFLRGYSIMNSYDVRTYPSALETLTALYRDAVEKRGSDWSGVNSYVESAIAKMDVRQKEILHKEISMMIMDTNVTAHCN